ncbi:reactivating factor for adenosylcobalamine-dependent D-ornithine aminomutase [Marinitoga sp. 1197]|uniref:GlmL-related ornithine degradation protein n=1 Tax=unclassified Marinitoga TaxID=2640159 RepID=UPI000640D802|nr:MULTISPECIES: GlmL-related ornithine degradation protein [unclassified Marinitoga]KLO24177.1 reactivating factor for adenosylcobalamine-dependent D-ornithine aminomutase [Marinitoga sp. 1197]NUV00477.1 DNA mismatch repair protein MutL [Marinitoga sp. 1154]
MKVDLITAEIGSTTTIVTAFDKITSKKPIILAQGEHYTTINEGDITIGIERALKIIQEKLGEKVSWNKFLATSSAAGGLKMTVHGLVYDMTVKASREAALGAGGVIKYITAGKMRKSHLKKILEINPNLIFLAGGVDYGEEETVLHNAELLRDLPINAPIIYAGNIAVVDEIKEILSNKKLYITENVYPKVDQLNVEPARKVIQEVFAEHIIHAPGMEKIEEYVDEKIIPTPAAVMRTTQLLSEIYEHVLTVDIGGATTDVDSVTEGDPEIQSIMISPEPIAKRTVEGDMGVFVNAHTVIDLIGENFLKEKFSNFDNLIKNISPYPKNDESEKFMAELAQYCFIEGIRRHAGKKKHIFTPLGRKTIAQGKDLTAVKYIFGTGGILTRSKFNKEILSSIINEHKKHPNELLPKNIKKIGYDKNYIFAPIGVLSMIDKQIAVNILNEDIEFFNL